MDFCRWKNQTVFLTCHTQQKRPTQALQAVLSRGTAETERHSLLESDSPRTCSLQSLLNSHALLSLHNASKAKANCTILQSILKETLSSSLACAILSFSREHAHVRCIHIQVLASQLLCQEWNAKVYLEWFCSHDS